MDDDRDNPPPPDKDSAFRHQKALFHQGLEDMFKGKATNTKFMMEDYHLFLCNNLEGWEGLDQAERAKRHNLARDNKHGCSLYGKIKKYSVETVGTTGGLNLRYLPKSAAEEAASADSGPIHAQEILPWVSHSGRVFQDLYDLHSDSGHGGESELHRRAKKAYGNSISKEICKLFMSTCITCKWVLFVFC